MTRRTLLWNRLAAIAPAAALSLAAASAADTIVVFNEVHYHPAAEEGGGEFIELYNQNAVDVDLSGWELTGGVDFLFPEGTVIGGGGYLVVAADPDALSAAAGIAGVLGPFGGQLDDGGETIRLRNRNRRIMDELEYGDRFPWPVAADGSGATLAKRRPDTPGADPDDWAHSIEPGGTPGQVNFRPGAGDGGGGNNLAFGKPVIDGSGAWNNQPFDGVNTDGNSFVAQNVTDGSTGDVFGTNYWLGREGRLNEYFTLDLGQVHTIEEIRLRNTHNTQYNDRGTIDFRIYASDAVDGSKRLVGPRLILSGRLSDVSGQEPIQADVFNAANGLASTEARYLQFVVLSAKNNNAGLNEIEVYPPEGDPGGGEPPPSVPIDLPLRFNEMAAGAGTSEQPFWLELHHGGSVVRALEGFVIASESGASFVFPAGSSIPEGGRLVVGAAELGFEPAVGERLFLYLPARIGILDGVAVGDRPLGRFPDGIGRRMFAPAGPQDVTPGEANRYSLVDDIVINEIMYHHRPRYATSGTPPTYATTDLLGWGATWRFNQSGTDPGPGWAAAVHAPGNGGWEAGPGPLGYETTLASQHVPIVTELASPSTNNPYVTTYYFETEFEVAPDRLAGIAQLRLTHEIDDGAIFYLNGQEVLRYGMPNGVVTAATTASRAGEAELITSAVGTEFLVAGVNRLSVEVHQASVGSSDVMMGAHLAAQELADPGTPGTPFAEDDLEWIELHNRGAGPVDVGGWRLEEGVRLTIPGGTSIPAGGYLVLTGDADAFAQRFPGVTAVGDWAGSLSNQGERIALVDALGNPADSVAYHDDLPWPPEADGGGSSLELRHPGAENAQPQAWAAGDSSAGSEWRTYSFSGVAANPRYSPGIFNFHELRVGLLDNGEVLIDDVSVVEDPSGTARELIANGSFQSAQGWRLLGSHRDSEVVDDGTGNNVLRIVAVDRMTYLNNLIESNLTSGGSLRPVQPGAEYRVTFRARWISGSPQLRMELYYNKLAHTFILDQPPNAGTPGARNASAEDDIGPVLGRLRHAPAVPSPDTPVSVTVEAADPDGVESLTLHYSINGGAFRQAEMERIGGTTAAGTWAGEIPGQANNAIVQFYVEAADAGTGRRTAFAPPAGRDSRALIRFATPSNTGTSQSLRLTMLPAEASSLHAAQDILSNRRYGLTVVVNEEDPVYDCGIRLRGSMFSRSNSGNTGLNIKFPSDHRFRGVHDTITTRRAGRREILAKHMVNHAGGIHDNYNDLVHQFGHIGAQTGRTRLEMARFGSAYLDGLPGGDGGEGTIFKMEGIREFQATQDGTPNTPKLPFPIGWISSFDIADQGDDKEVYRHNMRINSNFARDDYDAIIRMCKAFSLSGQELEDAAPMAIDVDAWMRQFAMLSLCGIGDTYTQGNPHNLNFYVRPSDGLVEPMPWDWDFTFSQGTTSSLWGGSNLSRIIARPVYTRLFHGHLLDIINTTFNDQYMTRWLTHYSAMSSEGYTGDIGYIRQRASYVRSRLPAEIPFEIATNGGAPVSVDGAYAVLEGRGWINVREIVDGTANTLPVRWLDGSRWQVVVPVPPGEHAVALTAIDHQGNPVGNDTITVTNTGSIEPASADNLAVSEIHYHPAADALEEFVELMNISPSGAEIDLTGIAFIEGVSFAFPDGTRIPPGGRLLVVQDFAAFTTRYGAGLPVAGTFADSTRLANGGETITLARIGGDIVRTFAYDDAAPWPTTPDGLGPSLVLASPMSNPDHADATKWRAGTVVGGTPGTGEPGGGFIGDPNGDDDGNGLPNLVDYALGNAVAADQVLGPVARLDESGHLVIEFPRHANADDIEWIVEFSRNLRDWIPTDGFIGPVGESDLGDGRRWVTHRSFNPVDRSEPWFVRVRVVLR